MACRTWREPRGAEGSGEGVLAGVGGKVAEEGMTGVTRGAVTTGVETLSLSGWDCVIDAGGGFFLGFLEFAATR